MVVRGARSANGIEAWSLTHHKYSPSTPATAPPDLMRAMSPGRVKNHHDMLPNIEEWRVRDAFSRDHGEQQSGKMKIAALVQMLPGDIRDAMCQSLDAQFTYRAIRDKVHNLVANRVSLEDPGPGPMDTGGLQEKDDDADAEEHLGAVGKGSRECWVGLRRAGPLLERMHHEWRQEGHGEVSEGEGPDCAWKRKGNPQGGGRHGVEW